MLKVEVGKLTIDRALKILKKKWDKTKTGKKAKEKMEYKKKSVKRREEIKKAIYIQKKFGDENNLC